MNTKINQIWNGFSIIEKEKITDTIFRMKKMSIIRDIAEPFKKKEDNGNIFANILANWNKMEFFMKI